MKRPGWHRVGSTTSGVAFVMSQLSVLSILLMTLLGFANVVGYRFFRLPIHGSIEATEALMVLIVFGGLAYAQVQRRHIRALLLYERLGGRGKSVLDLLASCTALLFFGLIVWAAGDLAYGSWLIRESAQGLVRFPLYPGRIALAVGAALMTVQLLLDTAHYFAECVRPPDTSGGEE